MNQEYPKTSSAYAELRRKQKRDWYHRNKYIIKIARDAGMTFEQARLAVMKGDDYERA